MLTEDGEIGVARTDIEIHRSVDIVLFGVEAAPATGPRLEYEQTFLCLVGQILPAGFTQKFRSADAIRNRDHREVGTDRGLGSDIYLRGARYAVYREGPLKVAGQRK